MRLPTPVMLEKVETDAYYPDVPVEMRQGIALHYDASSTDAGAVSWFKDPRCRVSYNYLVLDDGSYVEIAPVSGGAWHVGRSRPSARFDYRSGNRALWGIAVSTNDRVDATLWQHLTVAHLCRVLFAVAGWDTDEVWRITTHAAEAAPRGRKVDPIGNDPDNPILNVDDVRRLVREMGP